MLSVFTGVICVGFFFFISMTKAILNCYSTMTNCSKLTLSRRAVQNALLLLIKSKTKKIDV